jgi:adenylylsulfate kinase-like enzyme
MDENPETYCRYRNGLIDIFNRKLKNLPKNKPFVVWLAGPTGCGKTLMAMGMNP